MNLLEYYIVEVHSAETVIVPVPDVNAEYDGNPPKPNKYCQVEYVVVDLTVNCCGNIRRTVEHWRPEDWEEIKKNGYYWG